MLGLRQNVTRLLPLLSTKTVQADATATAYCGVMPMNGELASMAIKAEAALLHRQLKFSNFPFLFWARNCSTPSTNPASTTTLKSLKWHEESKLEKYFVLIRNATNQALSYAKKMFEKHILVKWSQLRGKLGKASQKEHKTD